MEAKYQKAIQERLARNDSDMFTNKKVMDPKRASSMLKPLTKNNRNTIKMTKNLPSYQDETMGSRIHGLRYNINDSKFKEVSDTYQLDPK